MSLFFAVIGQDLMRQHSLSLDGGSEYDPKVKPNIMMELSTAAFRFGHTLVPNRINLYTPPLPVDKVQKPSTYSGTEQLEDHFFRTDLLKNSLVYQLMAGLLYQPAENADYKVASSVRKKLFRKDGFFFGGDLPALNIQRGRDHSLGSYGDVRKACGLTPLTGSFEPKDKPAELPLHIWARLSSLYLVPDDVELFPAGLSETPVPGGLVGPTFGCIIARQFSNLKVGDR